MPPLKVLISGGGIAGNALAFWLSRLGHEVTVVERFSCLRATGLQIDLRGHGIEVMRRMGLEQAFRAKSAPEQGMQVVDRSGKRRAFFPANKSGKGLQSFTTDFEIMRGDLCRLIYDATKDRAKYIFGGSIESFEQRDGLVEVRFKGGKTDQFDLLVGADRQGSRTRRMMLGSDTPDAFYPLGNLYVSYFTIPRPIQEGEEYIATMYMAPERRGIMLRRHSPHEIQAYVGCTSSSERLRRAHRRDVGEQKEALAEILHGAGWQTEGILESLKDADDFYLEKIGIVKLDSWSRGRVTLVGDAAHCPSANTGMGTSSAIVGAYILAGEIGRHCGRPDREGAGSVVDAKDGLAVALKAYEEKFQPFMKQVQKGLLEGSQDDMMPSSQFGINVMNYVLGVVSFFKLNFLGRFLLREGVKGWDLPEYKEMVRDSK